MPASKGSKGRKIGRNKISCEAYRREGRQEKNAEARRVKNAKKQAKIRARNAPPEAPVGANSISTST